MSTFTRDVLPFRVQASAGSAVADFEVSTDGTVKTLGNQQFTGNLVVLGNFRVSGISSIDGVSNFKATIEANGFLKPTVTIGVSSLNPLVATRYLEMIATGGQKIFVPFVSVLPT